MTDNFFTLDKKVILVTGAAGHLGSAITRRLHQAGACLYMNGRDLEKLSELKQQIDDKSERLRPLPFDIADAKARDQALHTIKQETDSLDGLVNNAFIPHNAHFEVTDMDDFQKSFQVNVSATYDLSRKCFPLLQRKDGGAQGMSSIVNIASMYGMVSPDPSIYGDSGMNSPPFYGASKAALIQLTRYMAAHITEKGIRTNAVSPGPFPPASIKDTSPEFHKNLCAKTPIERIGNPEEVSATVHFLLSDDASYVNGANIPVDGGWTAW